MDYTSVRRELIRALRGNLTQGQLSRRLGYKTNQVYRWEAGKQSIRWTEFVALARVCKVDLRRVLGDLIKFDADPAKPRALIEHFVGDAKILDFTLRFQLSRFKVSRWLSGKSEPSLDEVLELIEKAQRGLFDFAYRLSSGRELPSFREQMDAKRRYMELLQQVPWAGVARMCLDVDEYRRLKNHRPGFLAEKLRIGADEEKRLLELLERAGTIRFENGKYRLIDLGINVRGDVAIETQLVRTYSEQAVSVYERQQGRPKESRFHLVLFSASEEANAKIEAEVNALYAKVRSILSEDPGKIERIRVLNLQLLGLEDMRFELAKEPGSPPRSG